jgi:hypothetical protein
MVFLPLVSGQFDPLRCGPSDQPVLEVSWPKLGGNARRPYPPDGGAEAEAEDRRPSQSNRVEGRPRESRP